MQVVICLNLVSTDGTEQADVAGNAWTYREMRQAGASDQEAHEGPWQPSQTVLPLSHKEASVEAVNGIAFATRYHPDWFGRVRITRKWRGNYCRAQPDRRREADLEK